MSAETEKAPDAPTFHTSVARLLGIELARRVDIYADVASSATLRDGTYWLEIFFSAGIATLGLTLDSPAVIIGAMLISPLMGPILAVGLALAAGDLLLAIRALANLFVSAVVAIGFATLLVMLLPFREMTGEIAARTHPNTLDLVIALFSGAVGSLATCKNVRGVASSIPGVAIAVALMPPLCVVGYGFGVIFTLDRVQGESVVRGGGLLFLTNLVAITFMAMVVFLVLQIGNAAVRERVRGQQGTRALARLLPQALVRVGSLPGRLLLVTFLVAALVVPLSRSLDSLQHEITQRKAESRLQKETLRLWNETFGRTKTGAIRSYVDTITAVDEQGRLAVHLRLFTNEPYSPEERAEFARRLARAAGRPPGTVDLSLVEIPTSEYDAAMRAKSEDVPAPPPTPPPPTLAQLIDTMRNRISESTADVQLPPPAVLAANTVALAAEGTRLDVSYVSSRDIDADAQQLLRDQYRRAVGDPSLAVSFTRIDPVAVVGFEKNRDVPDGRSAATLQSTAEVLARHSQWSLLIHPPARDRRESDRVQAIRNELVAVAGRVSVAERNAANDYRLQIVTTAADDSGPQQPPK